MVIDRSWFIVSNKLNKINFNGKSDFRYSEDFAKIILSNFTKQNDLVFDPFAGFGTTLFIAQKLKRRAIGIEYEKERCDFINLKLKKPNRIICGDACKINKYNLPKFDFCLTSPPYMRHYDVENPFTNYHKRGTYLEYLKTIKKIFSQVKTIMKKNAIIIVEISNTFGKGEPMTPLAWDVAKELSKILFFERELIFCYPNEKLKDNIANHSYCLIFRNR